MKEYDVVVIGLGPAGLGAAITAGRKGLDVLALESKAKIGGVISSCPGMPLGAGYPTDKPIGGIFTEFVESLLGNSPPMAKKIYSTLDNFGPEVVYDHDFAVEKLYNLLDNANVNYLLNTSVCDVTMDGNKVDYVTYANYSGINNVKGKVFLDCSGEGIVAYKAGVPYQKGNRNKKMMAGTLTFMMKNCDTKQIFSYDDPYYEEFATNGVNCGKLPSDMKKMYLMEGFHPGEVFFNNINVQGVDGTIPESVINSTRIALKKSEQVIKFLKDGGIPGFENASVFNTGSCIGIRETRKFEGLKTLTIGELQKATKFKDGIVCCDNPVDDVARDNEIMTHEAIVEDGNYYHIPLSVCIPKKIKNLLFAGRNISVDTYAFASVRGMPQCFAMGQAIATSAYFAIQDKCATQDVDKTSVIKDLQNQGINGIGGNSL